MCSLPWDGAHQDPASVPRGFALHPLKLSWSESEIHQHPALPHSNELLYIPRAADVH